MAGTTTYYGVTYPTSTDYVKDGATAIQTVATGFDSAVAIPTYNAQTGTTYTFALTDVGKTVTASNAGSSTYTIPPTASVAWPTNTTLNVTNLGAGVVTFAAGAGVTVTNTAVTLAQYASAALVRTGLNAWTVTSRSGGASASGLTFISKTTFAAVASISLPTNTFTSTYDNYRIICDFKADSSNADTLLRVRASGTDLTTSTYYWGRLFVGVAASVPFNSENNSNGTSINIGSAHTQAGIGGNQQIDIQSPMLATKTSVKQVGSGNSLSITGGLVDNTTAYDSITIFCSGQNITGTIRAYGYQNS